MSRKLDISSVSRLERYNGSLDHEELSRCEKVIQKGLKSFVEVGQHLAIIRDKRLYLANYSSFESYCRDRWGLSRPYAYKLMAGAKVVEDLSADQDVPVLPENPSQVREMTKLNKVDRIAAWKMVVDQSEIAKRPITAGLVREVVATFRPEILEQPTQSDNPKEPCAIAQLITQLEDAIACGNMNRLTELVTSLRQELHLEVG